MQLPVPALKVDCIDEPWIWWGSPEIGVQRADLDYLSYPSDRYPVFGKDRIPEGALGIPIFRTSSSSIKLKRRHSPPVISGVVVDETLKKIIENISGNNFIQFHPVIIIARGIEVHGYYWLYVLARVKCIDFDYEGMREVVHYESGPFIREARSFRYKPNCLGGHHIARESDHSPHLIVSDMLKRAVLATGEPIDFRRANEVAEPGYLCKPVG